MDKVKVTMKTSMKVMMRWVMRKKQGNKGKSLACSLCNSDYVHQFCSQGKRCIDNCCECEVSVRKWNVKLDCSCHMQCAYIMIVHVHTFSSQLIKHQVVIHTEDGRGEDI